MRQRIQLTMLICACLMIPVLAWMLVICRDAERGTDAPAGVIITEPTFDEIKFTVSAYCPCEDCCGRWSDNITASGHVIQPGDKFVAAPPMIPFDTMLDIPGYGIVPVLDRGGAIVDNRLDIYMDDHQDALNYGMRTLKVRLYVH